MFQKVIERPVLPSDPKSLAVMLQQVLQQYGYRLNNTPLHGEWTPTLTFATTGDLAVTYSRQEGFYTLIDDYVFFRLMCIGSYTHTTASGESRVSMPFTHYDDIFREVWWTFTKTVSLGSDVAIYASMRPNEAFAFPLTFPGDAVLTPSSFTGGAFDIRFNGHYRVKDT